MSKLSKKRLRDIMSNKSQFITIFLMIFIGIMAYSGIRSYMEGMANSADKFYKENNLEDLVAVKNNFSDEDLKKIKELENVNNAERKLVIQGTMEHKEDRTLQLNFIESNDISKFYVRDGIEFDSNKKGVWLDSYYADENNLKVGDKIAIKYGGELLEEEILGLVYSPDHVYDVKDESAILPEHKTYGFAYLSINEFPDKYIKKQAMEKAGIKDETIFDQLVTDFDYREYLVFNYLIVDVDSETNKNSVKLKIEDTISDLIMCSDIKDMPTYAAYQGEIEEGETYVGVFSGLFIFIAMLSVITTMTRIVKKQRIQIGTLKALGFKNATVTAHYVGYGLWISLVASVCGLIVGPLFIGNFFLSMEMSYFEVPNPASGVSLDSLIVAIGVVLGVVFVTYLTCRKELKENPADTLRTQMPKVKQGSLNATTKGLFKRLNFSNKWNFRDILRNKMRTFMGIVGITGCCMLLVCAFGMLDSLNHFLELQFDTVYDFNYKLILKSDIKEQQLSKIKDKYGNSTSQTLMIEIQDGNLRDANNAFVDDSESLVRMVDKKENYMEYQDDGIFVTRKLASNKGYKIGDTIKWHVYGESTWYESKIVGFNKDSQNQNISMSRKYIESLDREYKPDTLYTNSDLSEVKALDGVEVIQDKKAIKNGMENMLGTMKSMVILIIAIAALLGAIIIYNLGILSFTEKQYQFATLKVLGFRDEKIKKIYIKQNNWITTVSIIIGLPLGFCLTNFIYKMAIAENYDFCASIKLLSYLYSCIGTYIVSVLVSKLLAKKVSKIDMVTSLKGNE